MRKKWQKIDTDIAAEKWRQEGQKGAKKSLAQGQVGGGDYIVGAEKDVPRQHRLLRKLKGM